MGLCAVCVIDLKAEEVVRVLYLCAQTPEEALAKAKRQIDAADPLPLPNDAYHFHVHLLAQIVLPGRVIVTTRMQ